MREITEILALVERLNALPEFGMDRQTGEIERLVRVWQDSIRAVEDYKEIVNQELDNLLKRVKLHYTPEELAHLDKHP